MSWAIPGQGGHHHINEQPELHIHLEANRRGFCFDTVWTPRMRKLPHMLWFAKTIMIFRPCGTEVEATVLRKTNVTESARACSYFSNYSD